MKLFNFVFGKEHCKVDLGKQSFINTVSLDYKIEVVFRVLNFQTPFRKYLQVTSII